MIRRTIALLALHVGMPLNIDDLIDELWSDDPPVSARDTVVTYVHQMKKRHPSLSGVVACYAGRYVLRIDPASVDTVRFDQLVAKARTYFTGGSVRLADDALTAAFSLRRGMPLSDVDAGPVLSRMKVDLEDRFRTAQHLRVDVAMALGRSADVVDDLAALLRADPIREDTAAKLMLALYRSRRRAEALRVFRQTREALIAELGIEPCAELQLLQQQILRGDPPSRRTTVDRAKND